MASEGESVAWARMRWIEVLGTVVDTFGIGNAGLPDIEDVHPDANAASEAVMLLSAERFELPEGWNPFPDLDDPHGAIADAVADVLRWRSLKDEASLNANLIALVISYAVMGRVPDWQVAQPKFQMVDRAGKPAWFRTERYTDSFGREHVHEVDGFNSRAGRPHRGAYRKYRTSEPFGGAVQARIDWYLWAMAMERVAARLTGALKAHEIRPFSIAREPWLLERESQVVEMVSG